MIVRSHDDSLLLIPQPAHAALAGRIMDHWLTRGLPDEPRRTSILRAVAEHDNGWLEVDAAPLVDETTGRVLDFISASIAVRQGVWPRGVERLASDPLAAALVAEHAIQVYSRFQADPAWTTFFAGMAELRNHHTERAGLSVEELQRHYFFVRAGDLISLVFCNPWPDAQQLADHTITLTSPTVVTIHPDPFRGASVPFEITARKIPNRSFSPLELHAIFLDAPQITLTGTATGK